MQCVQTAVHTQIRTLAAESPKTRVAILTFNNEVTVYGAEAHVLRDSSGHFVR